jgi:preprotein translocase subunit SecY
MLQTAMNIFRVPELRRKILITAGLLIVYRIGAWVPLPGFDMDVVAAELKRMSGSATGQALALYSMFAGSALGQFTVFGLGIMPYISASIIFQLLSTVVPALERLKKEGESGYQKIHQWERMATVPLCMVQAFFIIKLLVRGRETGPSLLVPGVDTPWFWVMSVMTLTAGTVFLMWLGEQISEFGIGNGISLIIMAGIVVRMPQAVLMVSGRVADDLGKGDTNILINVLIMAVLFVAVIVGIIFITQGQRRIPVQQAKHTRGRRVYGGQKTYIPLRVNHSGVIPVIFASSLLFFPRMFSGWVGANWFGDFLTDLSTPGAYLYTMAYMGLIFFFCFFYTAITFNPVEMSDRMKQYGNFIPGIRPGRKTADYLEYVMTRITLAGAAFLAVVAVMPQLVGQTHQLMQYVASFYGGTGLLIVVGVALDLVQKVESHLMVRHYEGFFKRGRVHSGRG